MLRNRRIVRRSVSLLSILFITAFFFGAGGRVAHAQTARIPNSLTCYSDGTASLPGCDGYAPPPVSACQNSGDVVESTPMQAYDPTNGQLFTFATLELRFSNPMLGCLSFWGSFKVTDSRAVDITVTGYVTWESGSHCSDDSRGGQYVPSTTPFSLANNTWYSTVMVGSCQSIPTNCFNDGVNYTDNSAVNWQIRTNQYCD